MEFLCKRYNLVNQAKLLESDSDSQFVEAHMDENGIVVYDNCELVLNPA